jgi:DnaJ-domain-containing protein 1
MGILDRLGNLFRSCLDEEGGFFRRGRGYDGGREDPDLGAAWEELEGFLRGEKGRGSGQGDWSSPGGSRRWNSGEDWSGSGAFRREEPGGGRGGIPDSVRAAFAELGLEPGAPEEDCKGADKRLLKLHHPDRHAGHPGNMRKATEKTTRLNAAYDKIERWRKSGKAD